MIHTVKDLRDLSITPSTGSVPLCTLCIVIFGWRDLRSLGCGVSCLMNVLCKERNIYYIICKKHCLFLSKCERLIIISWLKKQTNKQTIQEPAWYKDKYESPMRSLNSDYKRFVDQCSITESLSILVASKSNNNHGVSQKPFQLSSKP